MDRPSLLVLILSACIIFPTLLRSKPVVIESKYDVRIERNIRIPMRDGKTLSADLIRPDAEGPFPILIEYHPYRKDDVSRGGHNQHWYLAERGFIGVRLDVRGTGGSDGTNTDEYVRQEQEDGYDAVEWLAEQSYSNGNVGMFGTSYGGFTSLQVAMNRPPHLKAIAPMYATDYRYTDDCHYTRGGNMRMYYDVGTYGGSMVGMNALPPLPDLSGPDWSDIWRERLEKNEPYLIKWLKNQLDNPYWHGASLRPEYDRIQCPVYVIAGWRDGYANAMMRVFQNITTPKKMLMGPWVHSRPHQSTPGPRIDHLNEMARFFAHYLRDEDTGFMDEPPVRVYMQEYTKPSRTLETTPGHWRNDTDIAPLNSTAGGATEQTFYLRSGGRLMTEPGRSQGFDEFEYIPTVGTANSYWSAGGISFYLPEDQRQDEALSLVYTSEPLRQDLRVLGWPKVVVHGSSSAEVATFVAKIAEVAPDGTSALIVDGSLNGTRRGALAQALKKPQPMEPGEVYELDIPMFPTGWVVKKGHRLRLAISGADFPNLWPTPFEATNRVYRGGQYESRLVLPVVPAPEFEAPEFLPAPQLETIVRSYGEPPTQQTIIDQISGTVSITNRRAGTVVLENNLGSLFRSGEYICTADRNDPAHANIVGTHTYTYKRDGDEIKVVAESSIRATRDAFHLLIHLNVTKNGQQFFQKSWTHSEPRRLM
jgi:hypothetical protein